MGYLPYQLVSRISSINSITHRVPCREIDTSMTREPLKPHQPRCVQASFRGFLLAEVAIYLEVAIYCKVSLAILSPFLLLKVDEYSNYYKQVEKIVPFFEPGWGQLGQVFPKLGGICSFHMTRLQSLQLLACKPLAHCGNLLSPCDS